jgi:hypothetical protein
MPRALTGGWRLADHCICRSASGASDIGCPVDPAVSEVVEQRPVAHFGGHSARSTHGPGRHSKYDRSGHGAMGRRHSWCHSDDPASCCSIHGFAALRHFRHQRWSRQLNRNSPIAEDFTLLLPFAGPRGSYRLGRCCRFHPGHTQKLRSDFGSNLDQTTFARPDTSPAHVTAPEFDDSVWVRVKVPKGLPIRPLTMDLTDHPSPMFRSCGSTTGLTRLQTGHFCTPTSP